MPNWTSLLRGRRRRGLLSALALAWSVALIGPHAPAANTFTVDSTIDEPNATLASPICETASHVCTLRAAIMASNASPGADTVRVPAGLYHLTIAGTDDTVQAGDLDLSEDVSIIGDGAGATIIDGGQLTPTDRLFDIQPGLVVTMAGLTLRNGSSPDGGGGIRVGDPAVSGVTTRLVLSNCSLLNNQTDNRGGGLASERTENQVSVTNCIFNGNSAAYGGAIDTWGSLTVSDSQFMSNTTGTGGGGLEQASGTTLISNSTFSGNNSNNGGAMEVNGGGLSMVGGTISANFASQAGGVRNAPGGSLTLRQLSLIGNGSLSLAGGLQNLGIAVLDGITIHLNTAIGQGGGIDNEGTLTVTNSLLSQNSSGTGGGIVVRDGTTMVIGSTLANNSANQGGGLDSERGVLVLINSTISGNTTTGPGAGLENHGPGSVTALGNVTIAYNLAGPSQTGGLVNDGGGSLFFGNSLIAWNNYAGPNGLVFATDDCSGAVTSAEYNLVRVWCGFSLASGDQVGTLVSPLDPLLGALANYGGPTPTHALLLGSPAIDMGNPAGCRDLGAVLLTTDQRGQPRPANGASATRCDIGAFEAQRLLFMSLVQR